jgi:uncharacterized protein (TIGR02271 family)
LNKEDTDDEVVRIPVVEEYLNISKQVTDTGQFLIQKQVEEKDVIADLSLTHDEVEIKRIEINRPVSNTPPAVRYEGNTMIISVLREELVVQRRLILAEEIHVTKKKKQHSVKEKMTIRKEKVNIKKTSDNGSNPDRFDDQ